MKAKSIIIIPARMQALRFPNKPLVDIDAIPMIIRVMRQAIKAHIGQVWIAAGDEIIAQTVKKHGGNAVLTENNLPSGTDRIYEALKKIEKIENQTFDNIINVQGDVPTICPQVIKTLNNALNLNNADITTACAKITKQAEINNPNVVKAYAKFNGKIARAISFRREAVGEPPFYHHIGIYGYLAKSLEKFVSLKQSQNEIKYKLEQLRALDAKMSIDICLVSHVPIGVDSPSDVKLVKQYLQLNKNDL